MKNKMVKQMKKEGRKEACQFCCLKKNLIQILKIRTKNCTVPILSRYTCFFFESLHLTYTRK